MSGRAAPTPGDYAWREQWKAEIASRARREVARWLQSAPETPLVAVKPQPVATTEAIPRFARETWKTQETGPVHTSTVMLSAASLLAPAISVRDTHELISAAVRWFYDQYHWLPQVAELYPLRAVAVAALFALDDACAAIGCYTIEVRPGHGVPCDGVRLIGRRHAWEEDIEDYWHL